MGKQFDILIIDDEQVVIDAIIKLCSSAGWLVDSALDGDGGLRKLNRNTYRLIICDIMMPGMDGFQFLNELSAKRIHTPTIITTGYSTVENAVRSLSSGGIDYLAKPFTEDELVSTVQRGLRYASIMQSPSENTDTFPYVPCPARYYCLGYSTWADIEKDGSLRIGVTDLFLRTINRITRMELLGTNNQLIQGNICAHFETEDQMVHNILSPITGKVIEQNPSIVEDLDLVEQDPYSRGWIYTILPSDLEYELRHLTPCGSERT